MFVNIFYREPPALGWQTNPFTSNGEDKVDFVDHAFYSRQYYARVIDQMPQFSQVDYQNCDDSTEPTRQKNAEFYRKIRNSNLSKYFGYVPLIGTLVGAGRIVTTIFDKNLPIKNKVAHILRGTVEFLSLGFLLLIPDFILSKCRGLHAKLPPVSSAENDSPGSSLDEEGPGPLERMGYARYENSL